MVHGALRPGQQIEPINQSVDVRDPSCDGWPAGPSSAHRAHAHAGPAAAAAAARSEDDIGAADDGDACAPLHWQRIRIWLPLPMQMPMLLRLTARIHVRVSLGHHACAGPQRACSFASRAQACTIVADAYVDACISRVEAELVVTSAGRDLLKNSAAACGGWLSSRAPRNSSMRSSTTTGTTADSWPQPQPRDDTVTA